MMTEAPLIPRHARVPQIDLAFSSIAFLLSLIQGTGVIRVTAGILVTTMIPGYVFSLCIFPTQGKLREIERWGLALIVSTCIGMFLPFALSETGLSVTRAHDSIAMAMLMFVLLTVALIRRRNVPVSEMYSPLFVFTRSFGWMALFVAFVVTVVTVVVQHNTALPPAFFATNTTGTFRHYPFDVNQGQKVYVQLHVVNPTTNVLQGIVEAKDQHGVFFTRKISVLQGANVVVRCQLPTQEKGIKEKVTFLFQSKNKEDSRSLSITYHTVGLP